MTAEKLPSSAKTGRPSAETVPPSAVVILYVNSDDLTEANTRVMPDGIPQPFSIDAGKVLILDYFSMSPSEPSGPHGCYLWVTIDKHPVWEAHFNMTGAVGEGIERPLPRIVVASGHSVWVAVITGSPDTNVPARTYLHGYLLAV